MRSLLINEKKYSIVPDPAIEIFEESTFTWYFGNCDERITPHLFDDMLNKDGWAYHYLAWLHRDIAEYQFASIEMPHSFNPNVFPVEWDDQDYDSMNDSTDYHWDNYEVNEMFFYLDIKTLLDKNHMFYFDSYAGNVIRKKTRVINPPIKGVW